MRILIVSQFYYPDVTACAFRIKETADLLAKAGCQVHVIAGEPHKGLIDGEVIDDGNITVTRVPLIKYKGHGKWNYIQHYLSFMFGAIRHAFRHPPYFDIVWATSPPLFTGIAGCLIARLKGARFCLDIRDIWPESAVVAGQISSGGLLFNGAKVVEKALYRLADQITCVAKPMAVYIQSISRRKIPEVIYNSIPAAMLGDDPQEVVGKPETISILYIGNMGYCQNLALVIEAAKLLKERKIGNIRFCLVGNGIEKPMLENMAAENNLDNVEIRGIVPKSEAIELIKNSEALMLHLKDDGTMDKTIPSKVFDYLAGGKPILFGLKGEAFDILEECGGNLYYDPASAQQLADQAQKLEQNYLTLARKALQNREMVKQRFLREHMAEKLLDLFKRLSNKA
ncbi:MAG: glycosyltransferase family 4 protein [Candidatus Rifleibacteriota bacterium]